MPTRDAVNALVFCRLVGGAHLLLPAALLGERAAEPGRRAGPGFARVCGHRADDQEGRPRDRPHVLRGRPPGSRPQCQKRAGGLGAAAPPAAEVVDWLAAAALFGEVSLVEVATFTADVRHSAVFENLLEGATLTFEGSLASNGPNPLVLVVFSPRRFALALVANGFFVRKVFVGVSFVLVARTGCCSAAVYHY